MRVKEESEKAGLKLNILAPQSRHTVHLRWYSQGAPRKQRNGAHSPTQTHSPPETVCSPSTRSPELRRPRKYTKCMPNTQRRSQNCLSVSCGGTGQKWPATGALGAADLGMA